jgi:tetratricopeptide (TPR) repeat protein
MIKTFPIAVILAVGNLVFGASAFAQADPCNIERDVSTKALDEPTWKRLNSIYEEVGNENYQQAREELLVMQKRARNDEYLEAIIYQALAQVQWALEDYDSALSSFERAVELDALPNETHFALMYQIAQLYYMKDRYRDALGRLDIWFCKAPKERIKPDAYVLKGSIHAQLNEWQETISAIDTAIGMSDDPRENWFQLKLASNFEMNDYPAAAATLEEIIKRWPNKKVYWSQLSNVWFKLEQDDKALAVMALAHRKNLLDTEGDYLYLSNLYSFRDVPYKAGETLQEGLDKGIVEASEKHWTLTGDAWYAAEELENALAAFEQAGKMATSGDMDLRRGYILIDLERWEAARDALVSALEKGGLTERKMGEGNLMLGMAEFNLGNWDRADNIWQVAQRYDASRKAAQQWRNHLREERSRKGP